DLYFGCDASCPHDFLSRQAICPANQRHQQQEREAPHRLLHTFTTPPSKLAPFSFYDLVGEREQPVRKGETQCPGNFRIEDKLKFRRPLHPHIAPPPPPPHPASL